MNETDVRRGFRHALLILAIKITTDVATGLAVLGIFGREVSATWAVVVSALGWIPVLGIIAVWQRRTAIPWRWTAKTRRILVVTVGAVAVLQAVILGWLGGDATTPLQDAMSTRGDLIAVAIYAVLVAPWVEELFFRGYLYAALERALGGWGAVVVVGLVFAVFHSMQYAGIPTALVAVALMGLATTWIRLATGGLWPCVVMHAVYNAVGVAMLWCAHGGY